MVSKQVSISHYQPYLPPQKKRTHTHTNTHTNHHNRTSVDKQAFSTSVCTKEVQTPSGSVTISVQLQKDEVTVYFSSLFLRTVS